LYDDAGERVIKRGRHGETVYVNRFYAIRNGELGTKHVFAGETRVLSKLVKTPPTSMSNTSGAKTTDTTTPIEKDQFYYHGDHLGSSNMITDAYGAIYQHLEYFPYGETWIEEGGSYGGNTPGYKFTGKELDPETGLYYYGARYYDPALSRWISADPAFESYLNGKRIYKSLSLSLYSYAFQNPLKFIDPDGNRALTNGEIELAKSVFGTSIDYSKTEIFADTDRAHVNPFTLNIHMGPEALTDVSKETLDSRATFIHEMTHIRQAQTLAGKLGLAIKAGAGHAWAAIKGFFIGLFTSKTIDQAIYEQDTKLYNFKNGESKSLGNYGKEQQGQIVQKNYERLENLKTTQPTTAEMNKAKEIIDKTKDFPKSLD
jgi:RHS repeat-associated protein